MPAFAYADSKITALTELTAPTTADILVVVDDVAGTPTTKKLSIENLLSIESFIDHVNLLSTGTKTHATIDSDISALDASTTSLKVDITDIEDSTSTLEGYIETLWVSTSTLETSIINLETSTSTLEGDISDLWTSTSTLETSIINLETSTSTLEGYVFDLWVDTASLRTDLDAIVDTTISTATVAIFDDMDDAGVAQNYRWIHNGTKWVAVPEDTSFTFTFDSFTDDQSGTQLIGSGVWQAIGGITFTATYTNGPPTSMAVVVSGNFASGSGWTADILTFADNPKTSSTTIEANNYPDTVLDVVTFTATADAEPTKNTTITFKNNTRWDVTSAAGTLSDADINALSNSDLSEDKTQSFGVLNPGAGEYIALAYPDRLGTLGSTIFRHLGMTAGFTLQNIDPHVNSVSYSENFNIYKSNLANMGSGTFQTTGSLLNQVRYDGVDTGTYNSAFIDALTGTDIDDDSTQTASTSGWSVIMSASNYSFIAVPSRWSLNIARFRYASGGEELQAGFTEVGTDVSWQNPAGYTENYDIFKSSIQDMADGDIGVGQSAERLRYYWGYSTVSSSFDESEVEAISNNTINQTNDATQTWGTFDPPAGNYLNLAVSGDATDLTVGTDYETDGNTGTAFLFDGMTAGINTKESVSIENEFGYTQVYDVYGGNQTNPGDNGGSGSFVTGSVQTLNKVYYGVTSTASGYTENDIESLPDDDGYEPITNDYTQIWTTVNLAAGEYGLWCFPKRFGEKDTDYSFKDNDTGLGFDFQAAETVSVTNENGWAEDYYAYRTTNANLGNITVETVP